MPEISRFFGIVIKMIFNDDKNLNNIPVDVHICKLFDKNNNLYGFIILIQDITEELRNKIQRETFIDIISHDLRNPMRANIQILELVLKNKFGYIENNLKVVIEELLNSCRYMNYMAENLVIKYKNEINISELLKEQYSIVKLIKDKCIKLNSITEKKHQTIELSIKDNIKDVSIDIDLIGKIINNIIINASEQSKEYSKIFINVENNKNNVEIYFIYNSGKNKKITEDVFDEYINCSNRFRKIGFGLEFYNCKKIIEAHNGIIIAENGSSTNTKIKITLPAIISE